MNPITLRAHFDGKNIILDEPVNLKPDTKLIVTVLPNSNNNGDPVDSDAEYEDYLKLSVLGLENAYEDDENEYPLHLIKEQNPEYEGG